MKIALPFIFAIIICSCKKDAVPVSPLWTVIHDTTITTILDAPDNLKAMFVHLQGKGNVVKTYSNNGLTESMAIRREVTELASTFKSSYEGIYRDTYYNMINYHYTSSLYGFNFTISQGYLWAIEYCFNFNKNPGFGYAAPWLVDSAFWGVGAPNYMLRFVADSGVNNRLSFPLSDQVSRSLQTCNDCFSELGNYSVRNRNYSHVYRFKNDQQIQQGNALNPHYLWIDRDYGIIQFQLKDSTVWSFDYP